MISILKWTYHIKLSLMTLAKIVNQSTLKLQGDLFIDSAGQIPINFTRNKNTKRTLSPYFMLNVVRLK